MTTIKKIVFILTFCFTASITFAQNSAVRKADAAQKDGELKDAKENIDEAVNHEKTRDEAKTWYTKGLVYEGILFSDNPEFQNLSDNAFQETTEAYKKAKELAGKETDPYYTFSDQALERIWGTYLNQGAEAYQAQNYDEAIKQFEKAMELKPEDTTAFLYAGVAAQQSQQFDKAMEYYTKLTSLGYDEMDIYNSMIYIARAKQEDNERALEIVREAKEKHPENKDLMKEEINLLIITEQVDEAKEKLTEAIATEPDNANLYYNLAFLYDQVDEEENAIENYKKAVEKDPDYFEANFNLGVLYYNKAAEILKEANNMDLKTYQKEGAAIEAKAKEAFKEALPYFEKAYELEPGDVTVMQSLQTVYSQLKMNEKLTEISQKLQDAGAAEGMQQDTTQEQ